MLGHYPRSSRAYKQGNRSGYLTTTLTVAVHGLFVRKTPHEGFIPICYDP
jgi:hypothetical protein